MRAKDIYNERYAPEYEALYIAHPQWKPKHQFNIDTIGHLLSPLSTWLDVCCGQGWHLSRFPTSRRMGIDLSAAQLSRARASNPGVELIQADIVDFDFADPQSFDLVTSFWGSYCYLDSVETIFALFDKMIRWTAPGGALYLELIVPETVTTFNRGAFAPVTATSVTQSEPDNLEWQFHDVGGTHDMISPTIESIVNHLAPHFATVNSQFTFNDMRQLIAQGRLRN